MKVLIADKFESSGLNGLKGLGLEVDFNPDLSADTLLEYLKSSDAEILVVRSTKVTAPMIDTSHLGLIIRAGAGFDTIDVARASERGVRVANCPGKNSQAVAELAFGLLLACDRKIADNTVDLRNGVWNKAKYSKAKGLYGRTLGLAGLGKISQEMVPRAKAFGMNVVAYSRFMRPEIAAALGIGRATTLTELAESSDFVSVHFSLTPETKGSINKQFFSAMKDGSIFINTSRGDVVNQQDLLWALENKGIYAGLDVFEGEPSGGTGTYDGALKGHPQITVTHHIGASTEQAQEAVAEETVRIAKEYLLYGNVPNAVNVQKGEHATHLIIIRHADRVGVLAHVLEVLRDEGINVQEMENVILGGAKAAIAQVAVDKCPTKEAIHKVKANPNVFDASVMELPKL